MAARSQSLAAAFAAQTWTVPVLPQRRHFLSYTHTYHTNHVLFLINGLFSA